MIGTVEEAQDKTLGMAVPVEGATATNENIAEAVLHQRCLQLASLRAQGLSTAKKSDSALALKDAGEHHIEIGF
jgi:hypothetical protein